MKKHALGPFSRIRNDPIYFLSTNCDIYFLSVLWLFDYIYHQITYQYTFKLDERHVSFIQCTVRIEVQIYFKIKGMKYSTTTFINYYHQCHISSFGYQLCMQSKSIAKHIIHHWYTYNVCTCNTVVPDPPWTGLLQMM